MPPSDHDYDKAQRLTEISLKKMVDTTDQLTHLSLPERTELVEEISKVKSNGIACIVDAGVQLNGKHWGNKKEQCREHRSAPHYCRWLVSRWLVTCPDQAPHEGRAMGGTTGRQLGA